MTGVAVMGALGRMGREACKAVVADGELELAGAVDPAVSSEAESVIVKGTDIKIEADRAALDTDRVKVIVDFTKADAAIQNIEWALENGIHAVVGTTGIPDEILDEISRKSRRSGSNVLIAPNFALGAVLMMKLSESAAGVYRQCEIIERHRFAKRDAPSGTALHTAKRVSSVIMGGATEPEEGAVSGPRGAGIGPVRIHSVRIDGYVASQEVVFGSQGETLTIRHDTTDRSCFMPGLIMAVKAVPELPGLTVGIDSLIEE